MKVRSIMIGIPHKHSKKFSAFLEGVKNCAVLHYVAWPDGEDTYTISVDRESAMFLLRELREVDYE